MKVTTLSIASLIDSIASESSCFPPPPPICQAPNPTSLTVRPDLPSARYFISIFPSSDPARGSRVLINNPPQAEKPFSSYPRPPHSGEPSPCIRLGRLPARPRPDLIQSLHVLFP